MDTLNNRLSTALFQPIMQTRCAELTVLFTRCNIKDLQTFYPVLLEQIFGTQYTRTSWGLHTIMSNSCDFQITQHFFSPMGPLFQLIYSLLQDITLKYKFNLSEMPNIKLSDFHLDTIYARSQTANKATVLLLNPFDYYIFSFAQHLLDNRHNNQESGHNLKLNSLYYILSCDYVLHFLPTNYNSVVLPEVAYDGKSSFMKTNPVVQRSLNNSNLFKQSTRSDARENSGYYHFHPKRDIWRSETILNVLIDIWLYIRPVGQYDFMTNPGYAELPSLEQIRTVRILVKQIHAFASVANLDQSNLTELRKICRSLLIEKIYTFLRYVIHRWPLDGSFRLVLELWLSYIQPWRYCSVAQNNFQQYYDEKQDGSGIKNKICSETYIPFIAENILHYVIIFKQLLPRFLRVDLSSPKNSLMLYRLMKVFNQDHLAQYLKHIEMHMDLENNSPIHYVQQYTHLPPLSLSSGWNTNENIGTGPLWSFNGTDHTQYESAYKNSLSNFGDKYSCMARQYIYKLEGVHFRYKSLLTGIPAKKVYELLKHIKLSERTAIEIIQARQVNNDKQYYGFLGLIRSFYYIWDSSLDDSNLDERRKVPLHLQCAFQYLIDMFKIQSYREDISFSSDSPSKYDDDLREGSISEIMSPEKVKQRTMSIAYQGDPDLYPISSHENTVLVRIMYQIALLLNNLYGEYIASLYEKPNYLGKICRRFITAPATVFNFTSPQKGRRRQIKSQLPPRISFRKIATNKIIIFLLASYLYLQYIEYNKWIYILIFSILFCIFHAISAFLNL